MEFEEIKNYIEENKDNEEIKSYVQGLNPINLDRVKAFVAEDKNAKSWLDSEKDKHYSKAFETWKSNNWEKELDTEIKKRFPEKDEKDVELEKMKVKLEKIEKDANRKELTNKALLVADEKKLPKDLIKYFIGKDEESTNSNLEALEKVFSKHVETLVNERLKKGSYTPPKGGNDKTFTLEQVKSMSQEEINKNWDAVQEVLKQGK